MTDRIITDRNLMDGRPAVQSSSGRNIIELKGIIKRFYIGQPNELEILHGIDLSVKEGEFVSIVGASGSGKTTLLNMLAGLTPYEGRIGNVPERISYIFQEERLLPNLTVKQNVALVLGKNADGKKISEMLEKVELSGKEDAYPAELSGGQAQRVSIARAFAYPSGLILMDEPFSALDKQTSNFLREELEQIWLETKKTILFITHSVEEAVYLADRVVVLSPDTQRIAEIVDVHLPRPRHVYSEEFVELRHRILDEVRGKA